MVNGTFHSNLTINTLKYVGILSRGGVLSKGFVIEEDNILNVSDQNELKK